MNWNNLTPDEYSRLCNCRSLKADIVPIAKAYRLEKGLDAETALEMSLEHLGANNQFFDLTPEDWNNAINELR